MSLAVDVGTAVLQASSLGRAGLPGALGGGLGGDGDGAEGESSSETHLDGFVGIKVRRGY